MPLVSDAIPTLINGISQQPPAMRLASQGEEQVNGYSSVVEGLTKRPSTQHVGKLLSSQVDNAFIHTINRDTTERYIVVVHDGDLTVFDIAGNQKTVAFPDGKAYLSATNPQANFRSITIADYTFLVNKTVEVTDDGTLSEDRGHEALVFIKQANYSTTYKVTVDTQVGEYTTSSSAADTSDIAADLKADLDGALTGFTISQEGPVLWIRKTDGSAFDISVEDSRSNTQMALATDITQRFSDLPETAPDGFVVEIRGDQTSDFDNYFVKFLANNSGQFSQGVWEETIKPGIPKALDASTMPHILVRESDGTFTFKEAEWDEREVGDEDSSPMPSFVGRKINDIFFWKNRLGVLADENVVMSKAAKFFDFFFSTVTTLVDDDPIDVAASHTKVSILRHAIPFNKQLLLFSDQTQFTIPGGDNALLASEPPDPDVLTEFESSLQVKPVGAGKVVFFATDHGDYSGIREYYILPDTDTEDAADITSHVPAYVPNGLFKLAASSNQDVLFALSNEQPNRAYVYKYFWAGNEKLQSSWSHFEFDEDCTVLNVDIIDNEAYFVMQYPDGVYLQRMRLEARYVDPYADFEYRLDRKITNHDCTITYDSAADETTYTLPYDIHGEIQVVTRHFNPSTESSTLPNGVYLKKTATGTDTVTVSGDHRTTPVYLGIEYGFRYVFSRQYLKENTPSGGRVIVSQGRLQLRNWAITHDSTGYYKVTVVPDGGDTYEYKMTGRMVGSLTAKIGEISLVNGTFTFPVNSKADRVIITITNDTVLPNRLLSAEWEGFYHSRSRRL